MNAAVMRTIDVLMATALLTIVLRYGDAFATVVTAIGSNTTQLYKAVTLQE